MKLLYLPLRARSEPLKMMLAYTGIDCEVITVSFDDWGTMKPTVPVNHGGKHQLPMLVLEDGTRIPESLDIAKYIVEQQSSGAGNGKGVSLAPKTTELQTKADILWKSSDTIGFGAINPILNWFPVDTAKERIPDYIMDVLPKSMYYLSTELGDGPYFLGADLTYCDFCIFHYLNNIHTLEGGVSMKKHNNLNDFYKRMESMDCVTKVLQERPTSNGREGCLLMENTPPSELDVVKTTLEKLK